MDGTEGVSLPERDEEEYQQEYREITLRNREVLTLSVTFSCSACFILQVLLQIWTGTCNTHYMVIEGKLNLYDDFKPKLQTYYDILL